MANPKWHAKWDQLVGSHPFITIKHFGNVQRENTSEWILNYTEEDFNESDLTGFERWLLGSLRRWMGRRRENLPGDKKEIHSYLSATCAHHTDRSHIPQAILRLVTGGFLIPTNQRDIYYNTEQYNTIQKASKPKNGDLERLVKLEKSQGEYYAGASWDTHVVASPVRQEVLDSLKRPNILQQVLASEE